MGAEGGRELRMNAGFEEWEVWGLADSRFCPSTDPFGNQDYPVNFFKFSLQLFLGTPF